MKILLTSDTHYGFSDKTDKIMRSFVEEVAHAIDHEGVSYCLHAGDISSHKHTQIRDFWKLWNEYISVPTYSVTGNHDYWDMQGASVEEFEQNIGNSVSGHAGAMLSSEVNLFWFNGFYGNDRPPTQDKYRIGIEVFNWLSWKAYNEYCMLLTNARECKDYKPDVKQILLTHYPLKSVYPDIESMNGNNSWWPEIPPLFDVVCWGHTHRRQDEVIDGVRVLNAGSDYDKPKYLIFEV